MKENTAIALLAVAIVSMTVGVLYLDNKGRKARWHAQFDGCVYLGSRVEGGFGSHTVYRFDCAGRIEETRHYYAHDE